MKCEKCNENEATFFYEETVNGKTRSYHLCRECAEKMKADGTLQWNFSNDAPFSFLSPMPDLLGGLFGAAIGQEKPKRGKTCPACGATWRELAQNGKVSCAECYRTFGEELDATLRQMHGNVTHTGRAPAKRRAVNEKKQKLERCRKELNEAIQCENFERAAQLRDEIRALNEEKEGN